MASLKYDIKNKDRLFFDRWRWSARFRCDGMYCLRDPQESWEEWEKYIDNRYRWYVGAPRWSASKLKTDISMLTTLARILHKNYGECRLMVSGPWAHVYTNDVDLIQTLHNLSFVSDWQLTEANPVLPRDRVVLRDSTHHLRSYFKDRLVTPEEKHHLKKFLQCQEEVRLSPGLHSWLDNSDSRSPIHPRLERHFFIDHDSAGIITMIGCIKSDIVRCTIPIVKVNI